MPWWESKLFKVISYILFGPNNGIYILDENWDSLIILDACRYDIFKNIAKELDLPGHLEYRISRGTDTRTFLIENFVKYNSPKLKEVVYVSANPFVDLLIRDRVFKVIPVWRYAWNDELNTVHPVHVYYYALLVAKKYSNKRIIVHFLQPHFPYTESFSSINTRLSKYIENLRQRGISNRLELPEENEIKLQNRIKRILKMIIKRSIYTFEPFAEINVNEHIKAYSENLKIVLLYAKRLAILLKGTTVITSDHGEAFGERLHQFIPFRVYGHVPGIRIESIMKVPWHVITDDEKDRIMPNRAEVFEEEYRRAIVNVFARRVKQSISTIIRKKR